MSIEGCNFIYNGFNSGDFKLYIAGFNSDEADVIGGDLKYSSLRLNGNSRSIITGSEYESNLSYTVQVLSDHKINDVSQAEIYRRFFNHRIFKPIYFVTPTAQKNVLNGAYLNCTLNNVKRIVCGGADGFGIYGYEFSINCDAPWAWRESPIKTYSNFSAPIKYINDSVSKDYVYPIVTFTYDRSVSENIYFINLSDDASRQTVFTGLSDNADYSIDSEMRTVSNALPDPYEGFNYVYPRLVPGRNSISVSGGVTNLTIKSRYATTVVI